MTAVIVFDADPARHAHINSSWWSGFLERHLDPVEGALRETLDVNVSVVGVVFPTMDPHERRTVARWMRASIDADTAASLLEGPSLEHITGIRAELAALIP